MQSLRTPSEEISGFFKVNEPGEQSVQLPDWFMFLHPERRNKILNKRLTLVGGRSTKVDYSPLFQTFPSIPPEMMTLETLQNSCD